MSVFSFFRNILGLSERPPEGGLNREDIGPGERPNEFRNPIWSLDDDDDDDDFRARPRRDFGFNIDSDPLEIHRFFEQQMEEMLRRFHSFGSGLGGMLGELEPPRAMPEGRQEGHRSLRDQYLKPGYDRDNSFDKQKRDSDLDDKIVAGELDKIFKAKPSLEPEGSHDHFLVKPEISRRTFGRSVVSKTVRRPDGSVEHHRTVRDNKGNEETTVTRQIGEQSYSVTTRTGTSGEQECIKNFVNVDEDNLQDFEKKWGSKL